MRLIHKLLVLAIAIGALLPTTLFAGGADYFCFESSLVTQMEADGLHVEITLTPWVWSSYCWASDPAGVDVYRRELGSTCGPQVLVTDEPLPWPGSVSEFEPLVLGEIVDDGAVANTAYEYVARAVDAQRDPIPGNDDAVLGYAAAGEALIGRGVLVAYPDCGVSGVSWLNPCDEECFPSLYVGSIATEAMPYVNSGTELLIYGVFDGLSFNLCNVHWPRVLVTHAEESTCIIATKPVTWGEVKSLYR